MKTYDILIPGNYYCDLIFTGLPEFPALGTEIFTNRLTVTVGGVLNTVIALRRLGVNVGWLGKLGTDFFSRFIWETIEAEGLDTSLVERIDQPFQRVTVSLSYPQDRAFVTFVEPAPTSVEMAFAALDKVAFRHLHFTGLQLDPRTPELLQMVRARGTTVSMDCQDRQVTVEEPIVRDVLSQLTLFMPNALEAKRLTDCETLADAAHTLQQIAPTLLVKDGAQGAHLWHDGQALHAPALRLIPVDTTGAGDVFNAGFLTAYLEGKDWEQCLRWGNICGGLSTLGSGGTSTAPDRAQVEGLLAI